MHRLRRGEDIISHKKTDVPKPTHPLFLFKQFECARGTNLNALAAGFADFNLIATLKFRLDNGFEASADKSENALSRILFTSPYTEIAKDALALVALNRNESRLLEALVDCACKSFGSDRLIVCIADKLTLLEIVATAFKTTPCFFSRLLFGEAVEDFFEITAA